MTALELSRAVCRETGKVILGKEDRIQRVLMALLADGHVLLDDLPGVGKTTLVKAMARALGCPSRRVQFVPDLLPADILGMNIFDRQSGSFRLQKGPVFTGILLADEINRAVPRTQAALLEAMEEKRVTIDGETMPLPDPFMVMATQNPVESESTFRLPAAQMDRFLIRIHMGYPTAAEEKRMLETLGDSVPLDRVLTVTGPEEIAALRQEIAKVKVKDEVSEYMVALTTATRTLPEVVMGASPRATRALYRACKAWSAMQGRDFVTPDDVQELAHDVLDHRILVSSKGRLTGTDGAAVVESVLQSTAVPPDRWSIFCEN